MTKGGFRLKREAQDTLATEMVADGRGERVEPSKLTLGEFLGNAVAPAPGRGQDSSTAADFTSISSSSASNPRSATCALTQFRTGRDRHAVRFAASRAVAGRQGGADSPRAQHQASFTPSCTLRSRYAVEIGLIRRNPAAAPPSDVKPKLRRTEMHTWTAEQLRVLLVSGRRRSPARRPSRSPRRPVCGGLSSSGCPLGRCGPRALADRGTPPGW